MDSQEFETYKYILEVPEKFISIGFYYAISWLPPTIEELKELVKQI